MAETATPPAGALRMRGRPKTAQPNKPKSSTIHPKYMEMSVSAINELKEERNGLSRQAILKYIMTNYNVGKDPKAVNTRLKMALKRGIATGVLKHAKGQGASGSFRISDKTGPAVRTPKRKALKRKAPVIEKVKVEIVKTPKKKTPKKKKAAVKIAKSPQKVVETKKTAVKTKQAKSPKKAVPKKSAAKPKKLMSSRKAKK